MCAGQRTTAQCLATIEPVMPSDNASESGIDRPHDQPVDLPGFAILNANDRWFLDAANCCFC